MNKEAYELLIRSLDQQLSQEEQHRLDAALRDSVELQQEKERLVKMREALGNLEYQFAPFFAGKVMHKIQQLERGEPRTMNSWGKAFQQIAIPSLAVLLLLIVVTWLTEGSISLEAMTGISQLYQEDVLAQYDTFGIDIK